jgi:hypothetical protein
MTYEEAEVGGVHGWWCRPDDAGGEAAILYLHGGANVVGSGTDPREVNQHPEQCRDGDQTIEFLGPVGMLVKTVLPSESLGDSVGT